MLMCDCSLEFEVIDSLYKKNSHMGTIGYVYSLITKKYAHLQSNLNNEYEDEIIARLVKEANDKAKIKDTDTSIYISFHIKYIRDIILLAIFIIHHKIPIKKYLQYACELTSGKIFIMYSDDSVYNQVIKDPIKINPIYNDIVFISDQIYLAAGIRFSENDGKEMMTGIFGIGSIIYFHINKVKSEHGTALKMDYIMINGNEKTGFDDFY